MLNLFSSTDLLFLIRYIMHMNEHSHSRKRPKLKYYQYWRTNAFWKMNVANKIWDINIANNI